MYHNPVHALLTPPVQAAAVVTVHLPDLHIHLRPLRRLLTIHQGPLPVVRIRVVVVPLLRVLTEALHRVVVQVRVHRVVVVDDKMWCV